MKIRYLLISATILAAGASTAWAASFDTVTGQSASHYTTTSSSKYHNEGTVDGVSMILDAVICDTNFNLLQEQPNGKVRFIQVTDGVDTNQNALKVVSGSYASSAAMGSFTPQVNCVNGQDPSGSLSTVFLKYDIQDGAGSLDLSSVGGIDQVFPEISFGIRTVSTSSVTTAPAPSLRASPEVLGLVDGKKLVHTLETSTNF